MTVDAALLRLYLEQRSEAAFASLVRRHVDLVYSSALETHTNVYALDLTDVGWRLQVPPEVLAEYEKILQGETTPAGADSRP